MRYAKYSFLGVIIGAVSLFTVVTVPTLPKTNVSHTEKEYKVLRVVDGDTVLVDASYLPKGLGNTLYLRIGGIDTPEKPPRSKCPIEKQKSQLAKLYVEEQLKSAKSVNIYYNGFDKYGRILGDLLIDGEYLSHQLIKQDLAVAYKGRGEKHDWCK